MPTIGEKPVQVDEPQLNADQSNSVAKGRTTNFLILLNKIGLNYKSNSSLFFTIWSKTSKTNTIKIPIPIYHCLKPSPITRSTVNPIQCTMGY